MEHKKELEELNKKSLQQLDEYLKSKENVPAEHHEKITTAKDKWQTAWNEFLETLIVLEKLEI